MVANSLLLFLSATPKKQTMAADNECLSSLERSFRSTCRVLFGQELGSMESCKHLFTYAAMPKKRKSSISGKEVYTCAPYKGGSRIISLDEKLVASKAKFSPNDIKDIDSAMRAAHEAAFYCGNKVIGNSRYCELCDNVTDSHFVYASHNVNKSEYISHSELIIKSKHIFGSSAVGEGEFCIGLSESSLGKRVFESAQIQTCSDIYFCFFARNCQDCMFSFSQQSKRFMIGNNQLERGRYIELKQDLIAQVADDIKSKKGRMLLSCIIGGL